MENPVSKFMQFLRRLALSREGTIAVAFAVLMPVVIGSAGMALDLSQAYLVRQRLHGALDAAALAGTAIGGDDAEIEEQVRDFFAKNYPEEKIGTAYGLTVDVNDGEVDVAAYADFPTAFMHVLGIHEITVRSGTVVSREVVGIEVVLVLDNTGSMATNDNIGTLRTAARNFVDIMFENAGDSEFLKIGMVPYSSAVNVGPYGIGVDHSGDDYGDPFVNNPDDYEYSRSDSDQWLGCVRAETTGTLDVEDHEGPWNMMGEEDQRCTTRRVGGRRVTTCTDYWNDIGSCPSAVTPLTSNENTLISAINAMSASGNTLGNVGMVWGYRMISPEFPFQEGSEWDNPNWRKVIIMMTDGDNYIGGDSTYTAYGYGSDHSITDTNLNQKFETVCDALRDQEVTVYTIVFTSGINNTTKGYYRRCATEESMYHYAPSQSDLMDVFEQIARELSSLHIRS